MFCLSLSGLVPASGWVLSHMTMIGMISRFLFVKVKHVCMKSLKFIFIIKYFDVYAHMLPLPSIFFRPFSLATKLFANSADGQTDAYQNNCWTRLKFDELI